MVTDLDSCVGFSDDRGARLLSLSNRAWKGLPIRAWDFDLWKPEHGWLFSGIVPGPLQSHRRDRIFFQGKVSFESVE